MKCARESERSLEKPHSWLAGRRQACSLFFGQFGKSKRRHAASLPWTGPRRNRKNRPMPENHSKRLSTPGFWDNIRDRSVEPQRPVPTTKRAIGEAKGFSGARRVERSQCRVFLGILDIDLGP